MTLEEACRTLKIPFDSPVEEAHNAYLKLAKIHHPDRYLTFTEKAIAANKFITIKKAYDFIVVNKDKNNNVVDRLIKKTKNIYGNEPVPPDDTVIKIFNSIFLPSFIISWAAAKLGIKPVFELSLKILLGIFWFIFLPFFLMTIFLPYVVIFYILKIPLIILGFKPNINSRIMINRLLYLLIEIIPSFFVIRLAFFLIKNAVKNGPGFPQLLANLLFVLVLIIINFIILEITGFIYYYFELKKIKSDLAMYNGPEL